MTEKRRRSAVHDSLMGVKTIAGVERGFAVANGTLAVEIVVGAHMIWPLSICLVLHLILVAITKRDPYIRRAWRQAQHQGTRYDPWPRPRPDYNHRPKGFGERLPC